jgi:hypothetical protein
MERDLHSASVLPGQDVLVAALGQERHGRATFLRAFEKVCEASYVVDVEPATAARWAGIPRQTPAVVVRARNQGHQASDAALKRRAVYVMALDQELDDHAIASVAEASIHGADRTAVVLNRSDLVADLAHRLARFYETLLGTDLLPTPMLVATLSSTAALAGSPADLDAIRQVTDFLIAEAGSGVADPDGFGAWIAESGLGAVREHARAGRKIPVMRDEELRWVDAAELTG